jgi:hypothetical protein
MRLTYLVEIEETVDRKDQCPTGGHGHRHSPHTVEREQFPRPDEGAETLLPMVQHKINYLTRFSSWYSTRKYDGDETD